MSNSSRDRESNSRNGSAMWECRYFLTQLPERFVPENLTPLFDIIGNPFPCTDDDIYLFSERSQANIKSGEETANIKLRRSRKTVKLKSLIKRYEGDRRFELWETEFEFPLTDCNTVWARIAVAFNLDSLDLLLSKSNPEEVLRIIRTNYPRIRILEVSKTRWLYASGDARLEVAEIQLGQQKLYSVQFEALELFDPQEIHEQLAAHDLTLHQNYVEAGLEVLSV